MSYHAVRLCTGWAASNMGDHIGFIKDEEIFEFNSGLNWSNKVYWTENENKLKAITYQEKKN